MMATVKRAFPLAALLVAACTNHDPPRPKSDAAPDVGGRFDAAKVADGSSSGAEAGGPGPDGGGAMCLGPIPNCAATAGGACDPVCQARCGCGQRCALFSGMPACV